jgi:hypothetical protein
VSRSKDAAVAPVAIEQLTDAEHLPDAAEHVVEAFRIHGVEEQAAPIHGERNRGSLPALAWVRDPRDAALSVDLPALDQSAFSRDPRPRA